MINKTFIVNFNKNKSKDLYRKIFNDNFKDNIKCRICNDVVYYYDSTFTIKSNKLSVKGKSSYSTKYIDREYHLSVCEDCLIDKYPEYNIKNKSRVFNQMNYITEFAYGIDKEVSLKYARGRFLC